MEIDSEPRRTVKRWAPRPAWTYIIHLFRTERRALTFTSGACITGGLRPCSYCQLAAILSPPLPSCLALWADWCHSRMLLGCVPLFHVQWKHVRQTDSFLSSVCYLRLIILVAIAELLLEDLFRKILKVSRVEHLALGLQRSAKALTVSTAGLSAGSGWKRQKQGNRMEFSQARINN